MKGKYKIGDKVVLTVSEKDEERYYPIYILNDNFYISEQGVDEHTEPLTAYTEPLEAKIRRQAAEITRLLAENKELKEKMKFDLPTLISEEDRRRMDINKARAEGQNEAWSMARKIFSMEIKDIEDIFITEDAWNLGTVLNNYTYQEAAAKVAEWEKTKKEIKIGDILEYIYDSNVKCVATNLYPSNMAYLVFDDGTAGIHELDDFKKTGRHMDIDSFLKQIRGEKNE